MKKYLILAAAVLAILAAYFIVSNLGSESNAEQITETEQESVEISTNSINGHEYVDLGLSVKWATCNVGATSPSEYGDYFAWGETVPESEYTKVDRQELNQDGDIAGTNRDAATVNWGGSWRMPSKAEWEELKDRCTWTYSGSGYRVVGPNGNSIFLPAGGHRTNLTSNLVGTLGEYWSSTFSKSNYADFAWYLLFNYSRFYVTENPCGGYLSVRPVSE